MTRIAISQRSVVEPNYGEERDCLDKRWYRLVNKVPITLVPMPNALDDPAKWLRSLDISGVILSGGNSLSHLDGVSGACKMRDATERAALDWASAESRPVLGVCRGMQMMNVYLGGTLSSTTGHAGTRHRVVSENTPIFNREVNSYHDYKIGPHDLADATEQMAADPDGNIEAFRHMTLPWLSIMWHPEREEVADMAELKFILDIFQLDW